MNDVTRYMCFGDGSMYAVKTDHACKEGEYVNALDYEKLESENSALNEQISEMSPEALHRLESDNLQLCENVTKLQEAIIEWSDGLNEHELMKLANHLIERLDKGKGVG